MVRHFFIASTALVGLLLCAPLQAALVITSVTRSLDVAATGGSPSSDTTTTAGTYLNSLSTTGTSPAGEVTADAIQVSDTPANIGLTMSGRGIVGSTAALTGPGGFSALADSFFDVTFEVDTAGLYALTADVSWSGDAAAYGGVAVIQLQDDAMNDLALVMRTFALQGFDSVATAVTLNPGTTYHLLSRGRLEGGGDPGEGLYGANASWEFELVAVPEAGAVLVMTPLAFVAAFFAWRGPRVARA